MKIIGLTGPSGSGKTQISAVFKENGFFVIDCDKVAREVSADSDVLALLENAFGGVVTNGRLDRKALAKKAFESKEKTQLLNSIMLPKIEDKIKLYIKALEEKGEKQVLLDAPTLFESGLKELCSNTIALLADESIRAKRIVKRDNLNAEQLASRLKSGRSKEFYSEKSDFVVYNNGDFADTQNEILKIIQKIKKGEK